MSGNWITDANRCTGPSADQLRRQREAYNDELLRRLDALAFAIPPIIVPADLPLLKQIKRYDDAIEAATMIPRELLMIERRDPNEAMIARDGKPCPPPLCPPGFDSYESIVLGRAMQVTHKHFNDSTWPGNFLR
jgi:hypothetical protein